MTAKKRPISQPWQPMVFTRWQQTPNVDGHLVTVAMWGNDRYTASVRQFKSGITEISYHRHDRAPVRDWRHGQRIKNEIAGTDREGMELYPAEDRKVDQANEYHIFVLPAGFRFPWGDTERRVADDMPIEHFVKGARQRPEGAEYQ